MAADITLVFKELNEHTDCGGVAINIFNQALHFSVATAEDHDVVGIDEIGQMNVGSYLNPLGNLAEPGQESSRLSN